MDHELDIKYILNVDLARRKFVLNVNGIAFEKLPRSGASQRHKAIKGRMEQAADDDCIDVDAERQAERDAALRQELRKIRYDLGIKQ